MRGNEPYLMRSQQEVIYDSFPIPMRGNEAIKLIIVTAAPRGVPDPHEG